jgi:hypothetical protein
MLARHKLWMTFFVLCVLACTTPRVETEIRGAPNLSGFATIHVPPATIAAGGAEPMDPEIGEALQIETKLELAARSFLFAEPGEADLRIELHLRQAVTTRQTWSSDPDASAIVYRDLPEAVLVVQVLDPATRLSCGGARAEPSYPSDRALSAPDSETIWRDTLDQVLDRFPGRAEAAAG